VPPEPLPFSEQLSTEPAKPQTPAPAQQQTTAPQQPRPRSPRRRPAHFTPGLTPAAQTLSLSSWLMLPTSPAPAPAFPLLPAAPSPHFSWCLGTLLDRDSLSVGHLRPCPADDRDKSPAPQKASFLHHFCTVTAPRCPALLPRPCHPSSHRHLWTSAGAGRDGGISILAPSPLWLCSSALPAWTGVSMALRCTGQDGPLG